MMCPWRLYALSIYLGGLFVARRSSAFNDSTSSGSCPIHTSKLTTASGKPVCRYALGGAAQSVQPESLAMKYRDILSENANHAAPFYFYYNPSRYPLFLSGLGKSFCNDKTSNNYRKNMFIASGGTDLSPKALDERLNDALVHSGGDYLDAFVLEYVCHELVSDNQQLGKELTQAIEHVRMMKREGKVRYVMTSTHCHLVGKVLASATLPSDTPAFDALMLRYNMSHKNAAESLSLPSAIQNNVPILAFTTTRWNRLQSDPPTNTGPYPTTADCLKFALQHSAVDIVLHSARDEKELDDAILPLLSCSTSEQPNWLSTNEYEQWRTYGSDENEWNEDDCFDEYPEESKLIKP